MVNAGPMTLIVGAVLVGCLIVGVAAIVRSVRRTSTNRKKVCRRCRNANPRHAKFCAHCGQHLNSS